MYDWIRTALAWIMLLVSFSAATAQTPLPPSRAYEVPVRQWLDGYLTYCAAHNIEPETTFHSPSIWLFSPDGAMVNLITVGDDPELHTLRASFPTPGPNKPLEGKLSLAQTREILSKTLGNDFLPKPVQGQWYAVLFLSSSASCEHCAAFDKNLAELEARAPDQLKAVRIRAMF